MEKIDPTILKQAKDKWNQNRLEHTLEDLSMLVKYSLEPFKTWAKREIKLRELKGLRKIRSIGKKDS